MCWGKKNLIFYAFFIVSIILFFVTITQANKKVQIKEKIVNTDPNLRDILVIKKHKKMLFFVSTENTVTEQFWKVVKKGVKSRFVYELELYKKVPYFFDTLVLEK